MKFGVRKPSVKKSIKARTTGKAKRAVKRSINPTYGKKGMGWVNNPKKTAYNKVYNKTTKFVTDFGSTKKRKKVSSSNYSSGGQYGNEQKSGCGCWTLLLAALIIPILAPFFPVFAVIALIIVVIVSLIRLGTRRNEEPAEQEEFDYSDNDFEDNGDNEDDHWDDF